jgi:Ohr subfamily peroxiredoxin
MENQIVFSANGAEPIDKILYTGKVRVTGGREGAAKSSDGHLDVNLSVPGARGYGTNPEQLFAAGWSACFIGAMRRNAPSLQIKLPADTSVNAEVDLGQVNQGFALKVRLQINLPGLTSEQAYKIVQVAHQTCPYSKATKGNIDVNITVTL